MEWGNFSFIHILTLFLVPITLIIFYFVLKKLKENTQTIILFILSLWGISAIIYNLVAWNTPLEYLPLHMCSINALLLPIAIITKNKFLNNLLPIYSLGALMAIVLNNNISNAKVFSLVFLFYYVPHLFEFIIPILQILLKRVKIELKYVLPSMIFTFVLYTIIHFINILLNNYFITNNILNYLGEIVYVNYMYSITPEGLPILSNLYKLIPYSYFYMFPFIAVIGLLYLIINIKNIIKKS